MFLKSMKSFHGLSKSTYFEDDWFHHIQGQRYKTEHIVILQIKSLQRLEKMSNLFSVLSLSINIVISSLIIKTLDMSTLSTTFDAPDFTLGHVTMRIETRTRKQDSR